MSNNLGFWTRIGSPWEPKMQWRWRVYIPLFGLEDRSGGNRGMDDDEVGDDLVWYAKSIDKPKFGTKPVEGEAPMGQAFNDKFVASFPEWKPITMTLVDPSEPNATRKLLRLIRRAGYQDEDAQEYNNRVHGTLYGSFSTKEYNKSLGTIRIEQLDPGSNGPRRGPLETWKLIKPFIIDADFGKLDYSSNNPVEITLSIGYSFAQCAQHGIAGLDDDDEGLGPEYINPITGENEHSKERTFLYFRDADPQPPALDPATTGGGTETTTTTTGGGTETTTTTTGGGTGGGTETPATGLGSPGNVDGIIR